MSKRGVVLCAMNNGMFDYAKFAIQAARRTHEFLDVPVCLISNAETIAKTDCSEFEMVIEIDLEPNKSQRRYFWKDASNQQIGVWNNYVRSYIYQHSPFEQTLTFDVDFVLQGDILSNVWHMDNQVMANKLAVDLDYNQLDFDAYIGTSKVPMYWSTVYYFERTPECEMFFKLVKHVHDNWMFYCYRYGMYSTLFRNDYAFTIANFIMSNFDIHEPFAQDLPYNKLVTGTDRDQLVQVNKDRLIFLREDGTLTSTRSDVHIMHKHSLELMTLAREPK